MSIKLKCTIVHKNCHFTLASNAISIYHYLILGVAHRAPFLYI